MWPFNSKPKKEVKPLPIEKQRVVEQNFREAIAKETKTDQSSISQERIAPYIDYWMDVLPVKLANSIKEKSSWVWIYATTTPALLPSLTKNEFRVVAEEFIAVFYATFGVKASFTFCATPFIEFKTKDLIKAFKTSKPQPEQPTDPKLHQQGIYR